MDLNSYIAGLRDALALVPNRCSCGATRQCGGLDHTLSCLHSIHTSIANCILESESRMLEECMPDEEPEEIEV